MTALSFFDLMLYHSSQNQCLSLNQLAVEAQEQCNVNISKQGLDFRMNNRAVEFIKSLLEKQISKHVAGTLDVALMRFFDRVRIKDSTKFDIYKQLKGFFPGFGGSASDASACIQYEFDLKSGKVLDLDLVPGRYSDSKDALEKVSDIHKNDLIIRDLGFFSLAVLSEIQKAKAFFISKLNFKTTVYEKKRGKLLELDFGKLYSNMKVSGVPKMEKQVLIGKEDRVPVRLIIELIPDEVYGERISKLNRYNHKKNRKTSTKYFERARFNLFVSNVDPKILTATTIPIFYKVRWQIELIFKVWKSTFGIHATRKMKIERFLCLLYSKLLLIMVNWEIIMVIRNSTYARTGRWLSIDKCFKTLKRHCDLFRHILRDTTFTIEKLVFWIRKRFDTKHWLEKRKSRINYQEILALYH